MISLDRNLSETWVIINAPSSQSKDSRERVEFLNFQLQKFVSSMSTGDFTPLAPSVVSPPWLRVSLKRFARLRVHHIKVLAYVGTFSSIKDLISQPQAAKGLITLAAESVDIYMEMMNDGGISPLILPSAIKILLSALSFMLLAVSQSATEYGPLCTKPFHTAIDILGHAQWSNKDPSIDICRTLEQLRSFAEIIQLSPFKRPGPLINHKQGADNTNTDLGQALCEGNVFDELQTPGSDIFSILGDVNMAQPDMLYINNIFS